ncbi:MAG: hypothetical protein HGA77_04935 [Chlorobiaceae bacterium]|nr:hypothetical protein [Chlorobiaceae bacterium]
MASVNPRQKLRGTASQNAAQTLPAGVIVYITDQRLIAVHDGITPGGTLFKPLPAQASAGEISGGNEGGLRLYSPADIVALINAHQKGILQVVSAEDSTALNTTSTTWQTAAAPAPSLVTKRANSKIMVSGFGHIRNASTSYYTYLDIRREVTGGSSVSAIMSSEIDTACLGAVAVKGPLNSDMIPVSWEFLDSPNVAAGTTITYKVNYKTSNASGTAYIGAANLPLVLTVKEVA